MTITLTKYTHNQWVKVGNVAGWLAASLACSALLAYITNHPALFGTTAPLFNFAGVALLQVFKQEETDSINNLPKGVQQEAKQAVVDAQGVITPTATIGSEARDS